MSLRALVPWCLALLPPLAQAQAASAPAPGWNDVAPILVGRCAKCHVNGGLMGPAPEGYLLVSHADALSATDRARVVPGNPAASELIRRVKGQSLPRMPFDGPPWLSAEEIDLLERWIAQGARDANGQPQPVPVGARVRLQGHLGADGRLDGLPLMSGGRMRVDKAPQPGDRVEVRGSLDAQGQVLVERLRRR
ncbi:Planctomycete cytochrome C [Burkholderiales bacterium JOSHI_001]|nr:Planctomycete cytochrome C [Burkholderiales bacterium JOSHI_001]